MSAGMMVLLPTTGTFDDGWRWFQRLAAHALRSIVAPIIDLVRWRRVRRARSGRRFSLSDNLHGIALPVIGSGIILLLFVAANPVLAQWIDRLTGPGVWEVDVVRIMIWITVLVAAWSLLHPRPIQPIVGTFDGSGDLPLPGVTVASVRRSLIAFNLLFAVQNAMDIAYLSAWVPMPAGITLADYAHRGAYPLIVTALLAALFVLVTLRPGSSTAAMPTIRRLVGCGLVFILWRLLGGRSAGWLINANLAAAGLVLSGFALTDSAAFVASWNARHARDVGGHGTALDLCYLHMLGDSSLPALIELEQRRDLDPALRDRVRYVRNSVLFALDRRMGNGGWTWQGERRLAAARGAFPDLPANLPMPGGDRRCDGRLKPPPAPPAPFTPPLTLEARP
jgi:hypothetical protein